MESRRKGRKEVDKPEVIRRAISKTRKVVESLEGEDLEIEIDKDSTMEGVEAMRQFGQLMADSMNRQFEEQKRREETTREI